MTFFTRCHACRLKQADCGSRHWRIQIDGFDEQIQPAASIGQARWRNYRAGREAGYFSGGFSDYLSRLSSVTDASDTILQARSAKL
ncbi:hypothetical protein [Aureimonas pseudogalii]|uniref:Uncharacterized protein n=1 Tax=Aureimonas pseudogalii TaxID=1744844 RepID=A0A7W6E9K0_9HYPH|nr:hypothetical protein [Aureimonas pseudogalii]MBB3997252.1 hypothetical protein [Aureimonas pseudogalii]